MKTKILSSIVVAGAMAAGSWCGLAQQIDFSQLPAAVQRAVNMVVGTSGISSIQQVDRNGTPAYEVRLPGGQAFDITQNGQILASGNGSGQSDVLQKIIGGLFGNNQNGTSQLTFGQLPLAVQNTVRTQAGTAPIQSLAMVSGNGQTRYDVTFDRNGQPVTLQVDPNGNILSQQSGSIMSSNPSVAPTNGGMAQARPAYVPDWKTAPIRIPLSGATQVNFRDLPEAVRNTLLTYSGGAPVGQISRGMIGGQTVYEAALRPGGQKMELRVADTGALINDQVNDRFLAQTTSGQSQASSVGSAPGSQSSSGSGSSVMAPLNNASLVSFNQLPQAVQTTIRAQAGSAPIDVVTQGSLDGKTVYDASFNRAGQIINLRVAEDGSVLASQSNSQ